MVQSKNALAGFCLVEFPKAGFGQDEPNRRVSEKFLEHGGRRHLGQKRGSGRLGISWIQPLQNIAARVGVNRTRVAHGGPQLEGWITAARSIIGHTPWYRWTQVVASTQTGCGIAGITFWYRRLQVAVSAASGGGIAVFTYWDRGLQVLPSGISVQGWVPSHRGAAVDMSQGMALHGAGWGCSCHGLRRYMPQGGCLHIQRWMTTCLEVGHIIPWCGAVHTTGS